MGLFTAVGDNECFAPCETSCLWVCRGSNRTKNFNTTNMRNHLQKKHHTEYSDYEANKKGRELKDKEITRKATNQPTLAEIQEHCITICFLIDKRKFINQLHKHIALNLISFQFSH